MKFIKNFFKPAIFAVVLVCTNNMFAASNSFSFNNSAIATQIIEPHGNFLNYISKHNAYITHKLPIFGPYPIDARQIKIALVEQNSNVSLWDANSGNIVKLFLNTSPTKLATFSPCCRFMITPSYAGQTDLHVTTQEFATIKVYNDRTALTFNIDDTLLAFGDNYNSINIYNTGSLPRCQCTLANPYRTQTYIPEVKSITFSPDSKLLAASFTQSEANTNTTGIAIWNLQTGDCKKIPYEQNYFCVHNLVFNNDGHLLGGVISQQPNCSSKICVWDVSSGECIKIIKTELDDSYTHDIRFSPDGRLLAAIVDTQGTMRFSTSSLVLWDLTSCEINFIFKYENNDMLRLAFNHNGSQIICGLDDGRIIIHSGLTH